MILSLRTRLIAVGLVLVLAGIAALVLLPTLERTIGQFERLAHGPHGIAGGLAQQLLTTATSTNPARPARPPARPAAHVPVARRPSAAAARPAITAVRPLAPASVARDRRPAAPVAAMRAGGRGGLPGWLIAVLIGICGGGVLACLAAGLTAVRRLRRRVRRDYGRFALGLSMHDEAKPEDVVDMAEALADALRRRLGQRLASGQPFCALELVFDGAEWMLCLVCERERVATLEGIVTQAYPDVWVGREFEGPRLPADCPLQVPGHVLRFRKRHRWMLPLSRDAARSANPRQRPSSAIEGIARAQVEAGAPSVVRFQLIPMAEGLERRLGRQLSAWQRRLQRAALSRAGASGSLTMSQQAQLSSAVAVQDRSLLFLEVQVAAADWEAANAIGSSVIARRGENHLHRRYLRVRQRLYRRRFPQATPPWLPARATIVSSAEIAFLLELPSARMKSVPVRRITRPRIPRPPDGCKPSVRLAQPPAAPVARQARANGSGAERGAARLRDRTAQRRPRPGTRQRQREGA